MAHAVQCPYCIDAYSQSCLENGANEEQMLIFTFAGIVLAATGLIIKYQYK